ncbi:MAG: hypothetical protein QGG39_07920, partial [Candidatus Poribacteria bacterium]|nr:hypothetical protein [Candidatus Poribacteria bacterium]
NVGGQLVADERLEFVFQRLDFCPQWVRQVMVHGVCRRDRRQLLDGIIEVATFGTKPTRGIARHRRIDTVCRSSPAPVSG